MSRLRAFVVIGALAAQISTVVAADMPKTLPPEMPFPVELLPPPQLFGANASRYLRGDLGYKWGSVGGAASAPSFGRPSTNGLDSGFTGGGGFGVKSDWLRTDVTFNYSAPLQYEGAIAPSGDVTAKISAPDILFNGYLDLGTWYHATASAGAGRTSGSMTFKNIAVHQARVGTPWSFYDVPVAN